MWRAGWGFDGSEIFGIDWAVEEEAESKNDAQRSAEQNCKEPGLVLAGSL